MQVFPDPRQVLYPSPYQQENKATLFWQRSCCQCVRTFLETTVNWIKPLERLMEAMVIVWCLDIILKSVSHSARRLTKA